MTFFFYLSVFFFFIVCLHVWGKGVGVRGTEHMWKSENNLRKLVLSSYSVIPGIELRSSGLAASAFIL